MLNKGSELSLVSTGKQDTLSPRLDQVRRVLEAFGGTMDAPSLDLGGIMDAPPFDSRGTMSAPGNATVFVM